MSIKFNRNRAPISLFYFVFLLFVFDSCSKTDVSPEKMDIDEYIRSLEYNQEEFLNVNDIDGSNTDRSILSEEVQGENPNAGVVNECRVITYGLEKNLDKVSILRPTNGVVWPGALVYGDEDLLMGVPRAISLDRAPMTLRLDLPGLEDEGNIEVDDPENTNVQSGINKALEWWNDNEYEDGYVNASLSEYQSTVSYSSNQLSLDLGISSEWATSSIESQLNSTTTTTKEVATMVFKQVFYSVTMDTPESPGSVFSSDVSLADVRGLIDESTPPAYVKSVDYGRILIFKMETETTDSDVSLEAVLEYATGVNNTSINSAFDQVLNNSSTTINVVTIGGNAEATSEAVNAVTLGSLSGILSGKNAVYSRDNPGLPIAYTIQYLKDNKLAKMGFSTDYSVSKCRAYSYNNTDIIVKNNFDVSNIRVKLFYTDSLGNSVNTSWETIKDETHEGKRLDEQVPDGAHSVRMNVEIWKLFDGWDELYEKNIGHVFPDEWCWESYYKSNGDKAFRRCS